MSQAVTISGRLNSDGQLELNEKVLLPPGPVRVSIEPAVVSPVCEAESAFVWPSAEELAHRKAAMAECIGCLSDEEAETILEVIEAEFEQVNLDEWR